MTLEDLLRDESLDDPATRAVLRDWLLDQRRDADAALLGGGEGPVLAWHVDARVLRDAAGRAWERMGSNRRSLALQLLDEDRVNWTPTTATAVRLAARLWGGRKVYRLRLCRDGQRFDASHGARLRSLDGWWY